MLRDIDVVAKEGTYRGVVRPKSNGSVGNEEDGSYFGVRAELCRRFAMTIDRVDLDPDITSSKTRTFREADVGVSRGLEAVGDTELDWPQNLKTGVRLQFERSELINPGFQPKDRLLLERHVAVVAWRSSRRLILWSYERRPAWADWRRYGKERHAQERRYAPVRCPTRR